MKTNLNKKDTSIMEYSDKELLNNFYVDVDKLVNGLQDDLANIFSKSVDYLKNTTANAGNNPTGGSNKNTPSNNNKSLPWIKHGLRGFVRKLWYGDHPSNPDWENVKENFSLKEYKIIKDQSLELGEKIIEVCLKDLVIQESEYKAEFKNLLADVTNKFKYDLRSLIFKHLKNKRNSVSKMDMETLANYRSNIPTSNASSASSSKIDLPPQSSTSTSSGTPKSRKPFEGPDDGGYSEPDIEDRPISDVPKTASSKPKARRKATSIPPFETAPDVAASSKPDVEPKTNRKKATSSSKTTSTPPFETTPDADANVNTTAEPDKAQASDGKVEPTKSAEKAPTVSNNKSKAQEDSSKPSDRVLDEDKAEELGVKLTIVDDAKEKRNTLKEYGLSLKSGRLIGMDSILDAIIVLKKIMDGVGPWDIDKNISEISSDFKEHLGADLTKAAKDFIIQAKSDPDILEKHLPGIDVRKSDPLPDMSDVDDDFSDFDEVKRRLSGDDHRRYAYILESRRIKDKKAKVEFLKNKMK